MKALHIYFLLTFCTLYSIGLLGQTKIIKENFQNYDTTRQGTGIVGKSLNLEDVNQRSFVSIDNPIGKQSDFTVNIWAKVNADSKKAYDIVSSLEVNDTLNHHWKTRITKFKQELPRDYSGWKIGVQANGAWSFSIQNNGLIHCYEPTEFQNIRDGNWHLLSFTYNYEHKEVSLYLDGKQKMILNVANLGEIDFSQEIILGNSKQYFEDTSISDQWETFYGQIDEFSIEDTLKTSKDIANYYEQVTGIKIKDSLKNLKNDELKVMAFNIWDGANHVGKEVGKKRLLELFDKEDADVYTLVETYGSGAEIADHLGFYYYLISSNLSIISRFPIEKTYTYKNSFLAGGAQIKLPDGKKINVFSIWISHLPGFRDLLKTENVDIASFLEEDNKTRGKQLNDILDTFKNIISDTHEIPVILGGDFNSGSHLDWSDKALGLKNKYVVDFNASKLVEQVGFIDSYRYIHPNSIESPGYTWSPFYTEHVKERIDYIYYKGDNLKAIESNVLDKSKNTFPSDHAGIITKFKIK